MELPAATSNMSSTPLEPLIHLSRLLHLELNGSYPVLDIHLHCLSRLTTLRVLNLSECKHITGSTLKHLSSISSLVQLKLEGCVQLLQSCFEQLALLTALRQLNLKNASSCDINRPVTKPLALLCQALSPLQALHILDLPSFLATPPDLANLAMLPSLQHLGVHAAPDRPTLQLLPGGSQLDFAPMAGLTFLQRLALPVHQGDDMQVVDHIPTALGPSSDRLVYLQLGSYAATDPVLSYLSTTLTALTALHFVCSESLSPTGLGHLSRLPALQLLSTEGGPSGYGWMAPLATLGNLCSLKLFDLRFDVDMRPLSCLTRLTELAFSCSPMVNTATLAPLSSLPSLRVLNMRGGCNGEVLRHIACIDGLRELSWSTGGDPATLLEMDELSRLSRLTALDLGMSTSRYRLSIYSEAHLSDLTSLRCLSIVDPSFQKDHQDLTILALPSALEHLDLHYATSYGFGELCSSGHDLLTSGHHLRKLSLQYPDLTIADWSQLSRLLHLRSLTVDGSSTFGDEALATGVVRLSRLEKLSCRECGGGDDTPMTPHGVLQLSVLPMLRCVRLHACAGIRGDGLGLPGFVVLKKPNVMDQYILRRC